MAAIFETTLDWKCVTFGGCLRHRPRNAIESRDTLCASLVECGCQWSQRRDWPFDVTKKTEAECNMSAVTGREYDSNCGSDTNKQRQSKVIDFCRPFPVVLLTSNLLILELYRWNINLYFRYIFYPWVNRLARFLSDDGEDRRRDIKLQKKKSLKLELRVCRIDLI